MGADNTSSNFIHKSYSSALDSDMSVAIANEDGMIVVLAVTLFIAGKDRMLETFMLELDKKDIEESTLAGTLVSSIEQGYLEMIQADKDAEIEFHKDCSHYMSTQEWMH